jgi:predicted transcriptional regulator
MAKLTGLTEHSVRQYRHLLIKRGYAERKSQLTDELCQRYNVDRTTARRLKLALKYQDILTSERDVDEIADRLSVAKSIVYNCRVALRKAGLLARDFRRNPEIDAIAQKYGIDDRQAKILHKALKYKDVLATANDKETMEEAAKRMGLSLNTIYCYRSALKKVGLAKTRNHSY